MTADRCRLIKEFTPGGREGDGLVLNHWVKKGSVEDENGLSSKFKAD